MSDPNPQPSPTYTALHKAATSFILAQRHVPDHPRRMDIPRLTSLVSATYTHTFGHAYAVSRAPPMQGTFDILRFVAHLEGMLPNLESWDMDVTDVVVDEMKRKVVVRVSYFMRAKGAEEVVENDLFWVLEVDGEGKVARSEEIVDGVAAGRLKEIVTGRKA